MAPMLSGRSLNRNFKGICRLGYVLLAVLFFIHHVNLPLTLIPVAGHDDGLFMSMGEKIATGQWLGAFNQFTLMKGVGLSVMLALLSIFKIPVPVFYAALIIFTCELLRRAIVALWGQYLVAGLVALLVMWYPGLDSTRILRDSLLTWETILAFACFLWFTVHFYNDPAPRSRMLNFLGLVLGYIFITREEGMTILVPVTFIVAILTFSFRRGEAEFPLKRKVTMLGIFVLCISLPWALVGTVNYSHYGKFIDNDFKETNFVKTLTLLQSIRSEKSVDFLPVPKDVRNKLYAGSPKFSELKPFLDGENAPLVGWQKPPCERFILTCGDYGGPWFFWALRDAVTLAGHYNSPVDAAAYYNSLNREIQQLCDSGKLECRRKLLPLPEISPEQWQKLPETFRAIIKNILLVTPPSLFNMPSIGSEQQLRLAADFLGVSNVAPAVENTDFNEARKIDLKSKFVYSKALVAKELVLKIYATLMPVLLVCGLLCTIALLLVRPLSKVNSLILVLAWGLPIARILMLAVTTISGFGDIFHFYIGFSGPMLIIASMLSIVLLLMSISRRSGLRSAQQ